MAARVLLRNALVCKLIYLLTVIAGKVVACVFLTMQLIQTRSSAIADKPRVPVCKVVEVLQDFLSEYNKFW